MARSGLLGWVRRCWRLARTSQHTGLTAGEVADLSRVVRSARAAGQLPTVDSPTRRQLLRTGLASLSGGLVLAHSGYAPAATPPQTPATPAPEPTGPAKVLIIGAGVAGLTAGYRLHQAGVAVQLVEAQTRVGGRMFSLRGHFPEGLVCELGGELIDTGHEHLRQLAEELQLPLDDLHADTQGLTEETFYFEGQSRTAEQTIAAMAPIVKAVDAAIKPLLDADGELREISAAQPQGARELDGLSIRDYLDRIPATGWARRLLEVAYTIEYGIDVENQSALNLITYLGRNPDEFEIFGDSDERYHIRGGNDQVPARLAQHLGGRIRQGLRLEALSRRADGQVVASLATSGGPAVELTAEHLIVTVPFSVLRTVKLDESLALSAAQRRTIAELGYGSNAKLMLGFTERVWRTAHKASGSLFTDLTMQSAWDTSRAQAGKAGILTNYTGGKYANEIKGQAAKAAATATADLQRIFPGTAAARLADRDVLFHWPSQPLTRGSYSGYLVGQWTTLGGIASQPAGNLHFAGEHTSQDAMGYMEGGVESGERVAAEVLDALGVVNPKAKKD